MQKATAPIVGDKIDISTDGRRFYKTSVWDTDENGFVLIGMPTYREEHLQLHLSDEVYLIFYRETGRYFAKMKVVNYHIKEDIQYSLLKQLTEPERNQRRQFYRLPANLEAMMFEYTDGIELTLTIKEDINEANMLVEARTKDISVSGIALITKRECVQGERYMLKLFFEESKDKDKGKGKDKDKDKESPPFVICASVMRTGLRLETGMYNVGMQFFGVTNNKSEYLSKFILTQQQKRIVQRRLIEGD